MGRNATRVELSYPTDLSDWGRRTVEGDPFRAYLRRVHDEAGPGDVWEEFVGVGCCGDTLDVPLRVESVAGEDGSESDGALAITPDTAFAFEEREEPAEGGGWRVQSGAGP